MAVTCERPHGEVALISSFDLLLTAGNSDFTITIVYFTLKGYLLPFPALLYSSHLAEEANSYPLRSPRALAHPQGRSVYPLSQRSKNNTPAQLMDSVQGFTIRAVPGLGEFFSCCCLPLVPQLACSILATWERPYSEALYRYQQKNETRFLFCKAPTMTRAPIQ